MSQPGKDVSRPAPSELRATFSLALPMVLVQVGIMAMGTVDTLMVGHVSGNVLAAVALGNIYFFNVSIFGTGTLMALDPLVSQAVGAGDAARARAAAHAAYVCGVGFMCVTALAFLFAPRLLASMMTSDPAVVAIAATLIPVAGVFQVFDGGQAVGAGVLRGIGDTRAPLIAMLAGYWLLGLPISVWLGFRTGLREVGLWYGFVVSLGVVAIFLVLRIRVLFGRELRRIELVGWEKHLTPSVDHRID